MIDKIMRDKIACALKDKNNGGIQAIYARIRKYGTPFKQVDGRYKHGDKPIVVAKDGLTRQAMHYRLNHGWVVKNGELVKEKHDE